VRLLAPGGALITGPDWPGPDAVLIGLDGDRAQGLAYAKWAQSTFPEAVILGYTADYTADTLAEAMSAGTRRVLQYPFHATEMLRAVAGARAERSELLKKARTKRKGTTGLLLPLHDEKGARDAESARRLLVVCSPKGGVGSSTLAVNLAVAIRFAGQHAVLVDGNISFGSHDVFLKLPPVRSMVHALADDGQIDEEHVMSALMRHSSGLYVMLAPVHPEDGERIDAGHMLRMLQILKDRFAFTVVDASPPNDSRVLAALQVADTIIVPIGPDFPSLKNLMSFLHMLTLLQVNLDRITPVLVRSDGVPADHVKALEEATGRELHWRIVSDWERTSLAANTGTPFVLGAPNAEISKTVVGLARSFVGADAKAGQSGPPSSKQTAGKFWGRS